MAATVACRSYPRQPPGPADPPVPLLPADGHRGAKRQHLGQDGDGPVVQADTAAGHLPTQVAGVGGAMQRDLAVAGAELLQHVGVARQPQGPRPVHRRDLWWAELDGEIEAAGRRGRGLAADPDRPTPHSAAVTQQPRRPCRQVDLYLVEDRTKPHLVAADPTGALIGPAGKEYLEPCAAGDVPVGLPD